MVDRMKLLLSKVYMHVTAKATCFININTLISSMVPELQNSLTILNIVCLLPDKI